MRPFTVGIVLGVAGTVVAGVAALRLMGRPEPEALPEGMARDAWGRLHVTPPSR